MKTAASAPANARTWISPNPRNAIRNGITTAIAAPRAAPDAVPSTYGSASGLRKQTLERRPGDGQPGRRPPSASGRAAAAGPRRSSRLPPTKRRRSSIPNSRSREDPERVGRRDRDGPEPDAEHQCDRERNRTTDSQEDRSPPDAPDPGDRRSRGNALASLVIGPSWRRRGRRRRRRSSRRAAARGPDGSPGRGRGGRRRGAGPGG